MRTSAILLALACALTIASPAAAVAAQRGPRGVELPEPVPCDGCWAPAIETSWQWQLQGPIDRSFDVDMYDVDAFEVPRGVVSALHDEGSDVVCYISVGSWERWRPDAGRFPERVLGRSNGWPGERWLDIRRRAVLRPIVERRLDLCAHKGFDAVEFDNVDGYANRTGFPLTGADQLRYNVMLANEAHRRGLSAMLKNDLGQIRTLLPYFDAALNEQCPTSTTSAGGSIDSSRQGRRSSAWSTSSRPRRSVRRRTRTTSTSCRSGSRSAPGASRAADAGSRRCLTADPDGRVVMVSHCVHTYAP